MTRNILATMDTKTCCVYYLTPVGVGAGERGAPLSRPPPIMHAMLLTVRYCCKSVGCKGRKVGTRSREVGKSLGSKCLSRCLTCAHVTWLPRPSHLLVPHCRRPAPAHQWLTRCSCSFQMDVKSVGSFYYENFVSCLIIT